MTPRPVGKFRTRESEWADFDNTDLYLDMDPFTPCPKCGAEWGKEFCNKWELSRPRREYLCTKCRECGYKYVIDGPFGIADINTGEPASIAYLSDDGEWYVTEAFPIEEPGYEYYLVYGNGLYWIYMLILSDGRIFSNADGSFENDPIISQMVGDDIPTDVYDAAVSILWKQMKKPVRKKPTSKKSTIKKTTAKKTPTKKTTKSAPRRR